MFCIVMLQFSIVQSNSLYLVKQNKTACIARSYNSRIEHMSDIHGARLKLSINSYAMLFQEWEPKVKYYGNWSEENLKSILTSNSTY